MRLLSSTAVLLVCVGLALAGPAKKKIEKKSISNSLAPKAIEPVDQKLDEPAKLSDEALMEIAGENVDRAKKQASTTFCVEIRQNKPTRVDCDELNNRPMPPPPPPPAAEPEPQEPLPPPPPPPPAAPAPVHNQQPEDFKFQLPCDPEIAAFYVQPPGEVVYAPTGNCAPIVPSGSAFGGSPSGINLIHVPSGSYPGGLAPGASGTPSINVLHMPTAGGHYPGGLAPGASGTPSINFLHMPTAGGHYPGGFGPGASGTPSINVLHMPTTGGHYPAGFAPGSSGSPSVNIATMPSGSFPGGAAPGGSGSPSVNVVPLGTGSLSGGSGSPINVLHMPSGSLSGGSGSPINVLHMPSGSLSGAGHAPTIHITGPSAAAGASAGTTADCGPSVIPIHGLHPTNLIPSVTHIIQPSPLHHHGIHAGLHAHKGLPLQGHGGIHGLHQLAGVECTCKSTPGVLGKSSEGPQSNEALAMKFLQDLQRNAGGSPPSMVQVGPGMSASSLKQSGKSDMRYMPIRPMSNVQQQVVYQQQSSAMHPMGGMDMPMYPMHGYGMMPGMYPGGMLRSNGGSLQDSFSNAAQLLPQGLRLSREEAEAKEQQEQTASEAKPEEAKPSESMNAMSEQNQEASGKDDGSARIARFLAEKDVESNVLDEKSA